MFKTTRAVIVWVCNQHLERVHTRCIIFMYIPLAKWGIAAFPYSMMHASSFGVGKFLEHGRNWGAFDSMK